MCFARAHYPNPSLVSIIYHSMLQYVGLRFPLLKSLEYFPFEALGLLWWFLINNWILQREIRWGRGGDCDANNQNSWGKISFLLLYFLCTEPGTDVLKPEGNNTDPPDTSTKWSFWMFFFFTLTAIFLIIKKKPRRGAVVPSDKQTNKLTNSCLWSKVGWRYRLYTCHLHKLSIMCTVYTCR